MIDRQCSSPHIHHVKKQQATPNSILVLCNNSHDIAGLNGADNAFRMARILSYRGALCRARHKLLRCLVDSTDITRSSPAMRSKAVKAIGMVLDVDASLLRLPELQLGINRALQVSPHAIQSPHASWWGRPQGQ